jgi:sulfur-oxidizing protein SoxX
VSLARKALMTTCVALSLTSCMTSTTGDSQPRLAAVNGDIRQGQAIFNSRDKGHCLLCHQLASNAEAFQGTIGPPLDNIGDRLSAGQLRYRVVDSSRLNPDTRMPAYFKTEGLHQVAAEFVGQPVLNAQEVEHLVAYLSAQRSDHRESD